MPDPRRFDTADYPEGMRCTDCREAFVQGQVIEDRINGVDTCGDLADLFPEANASRDDLLTYTEPVCTPCAIGAKP